METTPSDGIKRWKALVCLERGGDGRFGFGGIGGRRPSLDNEVLLTSDFSLWARKYDDGVVNLRAGLLCAGSNWAVETLGGEQLRLTPGTSPDEGDKGSGSSGHTSTGCLCSDDKDEERGVDGGGAGDEGGEHVDPDGRTENTPSSDGSFGGSRGKVDGLGGSHFVFSALSTPSAIFLVIGFDGLIRRVVFGKH